MATNVQVSANGSDDDPLKYNEAFPPLPGAFAASAGARGPALRSAKQVITSMMHIPFEERKFKDPIGAQQEAQTRVCQQIMQEFSVKLELTATRNGQLTVVLTGKADAVAKARRQVATDLQTRASNQLNIPREHYGFILGRNRQRLNTLQEQTNTEIFVPGPNDPNGMIRVSGTREGVIAACAELRKWSEERSKLAEERLQVDRSLHAFIAGPGGEFVKHHESTYNVRIHMPPPKRAAATDAAPAAGNAPQNARGASHHSENEIVISGDREAVAAVKAAVMKIVNEKQGKIQAIPVKISKTQHRYVIGRNGANLADIQRETGVVVEVPPAESAIETITLRGEQSQLGRAVTLVYEKANSVVRVVVPAATWLHRHVIGRDGAKLNELLTAAGTTRDRVRVEFETDAEVTTKTPGIAAAQGARIILEGAPAECEAVRARIEAYLSELRRTVTCRELHVEARFVKHLIGKKGATINKIKNETGCQIVIPSEHEQEGAAVIRIEGEPSAVEKARAELDEIHKRIQNETQKDVEIEQKLHKQIIGAKGERIREIRNEFTDVQITFPEPGRRSDIVQLRGPRADVDRCAKQLLKCAQELAERSYESNMHVSREYVRYVVGKGGATLNKLREEHDVRINIPGDQPAGISSPSTGTEGEIATIEFIGRKKNVEAAKKAIENLVKEVAKIRELRIDVSPAVLNALLQNARFIKQLRDECQPVTVRLPDAPAAKTAAKTPTPAESFITLRGLEKEVDVAKQKANKLLDEIRENSFVDSIIVRPEFHRFLVGRNHANVKRYREESNVRVVVPIANRAAATSEEDGVVPPATADGDDRSRITLIGKQADVAHVKQDLERVVRELENTIETTVEIDAKWHKRFLQRSGILVRQISEELGNVVISFPKHVSPKHAAKKDEQEKPAEEDASGQQSNTVRIKGPRDCVNEAVKRLQEQVNDWQNEVTNECSIPRRYHAAMLANRGTYVQQIAERHSVVIRFPERRTSPKQPAAQGKPAEAAAEHTEADAEHEAAPDAVETHDEEAVPAVTAAGTQDSAEEEGGAADIITVIGKRENVDLACEELRKLVPITEYFELTNDCITQCRNLSVVEMRRMMQEFSVRLTVLDEPERGEETKRVEIYGIPTRIEDTKRELAKRVEQYDAWRREQAARNARTVVHVAEKWHSNLIGRKGERIQSLQKRFGVRILLGNRGPANRARADAAPNAAEKRDANDEHTEQQTATEANATTEQTANTEHTEQSDDGEVQQKAEHANTTEESEQTEETAHGADEIVIVGYVERAAECVQEIEKLVAEWELQVTESVDIDARVHPRLIGARGARLKELMDRFNVRITISRDTAYPDRVTVSGRKEKVAECIEEMLSIADEYMQDFEYVSRSKTRTLADHFGGAAAPTATPAAEQQPAQPKAHSGKKGIKIVGGPWDTAAKAGAGSGKQYEEDFPAMEHTNGTTRGPTTPEAHAVSNGVPVWTGAKR